MDHSPKFSYGNKGFLAIFFKFSSHACYMAPRLHCQIVNLSHKIFIIPIPLSSPLEQSRVCDAKSLDKNDFWAVVPLSTPPSTMWHAIYIIFQATFISPLQKYLTEAKRSKEDDCPSDICMHELHSLRLFKIAYLYSIILDHPFLVQELFLVDQNDFKPLATADTVNIGF